MKDVTMKQKEIGKVIKAFRKAFRLAFADEGAQGEGSAPEGGQSANPDNSQATQDPPQAQSTAPNYNLMKDPQVAQLVQNARTEEKQKLHKELDTLKQQVANEKAENTQLAVKLGEQTNEATRLQGEITRLENEANMNADDQVKAIKATLAEKDKEIARLSGELTQASIKYNTLELSNYKQQKIANANGNIIEEMVTGATMDEIDASVEIAKATFLKYNPTAQGDTPQGDPPQGNPPAQPPVHVPATNPPRGGDNNHIELSSMNVMKNPADYRKYAEARATMGMRD